MHWRFQRNYWIADLLHILKCGRTWLLTNCIYVQYQNFNHFRFYIHLEKRDSYAKEFIHYAEASLSLSLTRLGTHCLENYFGNVCNLCKDFDSYENILITLSNWESQTNLSYILQKFWKANIIIMIGMYIF